MEAFSTGFKGPPGSWEWPDDVPAQSAQSHTRPSTASSRSGARHDPGGVPRPQSRRHWAPRTCRICLETVLPSFDPPSDYLPDVLQPGPSVHYNSEGGRLISPCKCKGSSRYVHESCLQQWRHADPSYGSRAFWNCPTCGTSYRLERMRWGRWISSTATQFALTISIFLAATFLLGFVADPIINLYLDPYNTLSSPMSSFDDVVEDGGWTYHLLKGTAALGLTGFVKVFFTLGPWQWWHIRNSGVLNGGGGRAGNTGRDRLANISWAVVLLGVGTFLYAVYKGVRAWSRRLLERAGERVVDVQSDEFDDDDDDGGT